MPHLNNKTKIQTQSSADRTPPHSALPVRGETNKQKLSTNLTLYEAHTNHWTKLRGRKPKGRKHSTLKPGKRRPQTQSVFFKKIVKRQRNTTQMKEQTRNTEVQINEEEIGKLPEK